MTFKIALAGAASVLLFGSAAWAQATAPTGTTAETGTTTQGQTAAQTGAMSQAPAGAQAGAMTQEPTGAQAGTMTGQMQFTDAQVRNFARATARIQAMQDAGTPPDNTAMAQAVQEAGLTVEEYNQIANQVRDDPALGQRVAREMQQAQAGATAGTTAQTGQMDPMGQSGAQAQSNLQAQSGAQTGETAGASATAQGQREPVDTSTARPYNEAWPNAGESGSDAMARAGERG